MTASEIWIDHVSGALTELCGAQAWSRWVQPGPSGLAGLPQEATDSSARIFKSLVEASMREAAAGAQEVAAALISNFKLAAQLDYLNLRFCHGCFVEAGYYAPHWFLAVNLAS